MSFAAVVFDLDDTLYPEWSYTESGFIAVEQLLIGEAMTDPDGGLAQQWYHLRRSGEQRVFDTWLDQGGDAAVRCLQMWGSFEQARDGLIATFRAHSPAISPFAGVSDLLADLRRSSTTKVGLVSDGNLEVQRAKFAALGLSSSFDAVVFSDEFGREHWKPHPLPFQEASRCLGVQPTHAVYIADNPAKDFFGARQGGMQSIRLRIEGCVYSKDEPQASDYQPDAEVRTQQLERSGHPAACTADAAGRRRQRVGRSGHARRRGAARRCDHSGGHPRRVVCHGDPRRRPGSGRLGQHAHPGGVGRLDRFGQRHPAGHRLRVGQPAPDRCRRCGRRSRHGGRRWLPSPQDRQGLSFPPSSSWPDSAR